MSDETPSAAEPAPKRLAEDTLRAVLAARVSEPPFAVGECLAERNEPLIALTSDRQIRAADRAAAERWLGYGPHEPDGRPLEVLVPPHAGLPDAPASVVTADLTVIEMPRLQKGGAEAASLSMFGASPVATGRIFSMPNVDVDARDEEP
jgi:hypothetical protein